MRHVEGMAKYVLGQIVWLVCAVVAVAAVPPELNNASVTLPYGELKTLWQAAQTQIAPQKRKPPVEATLLAARYQIALKGDQASGIVEYEAQSFTDDWTVIPLLGAQTQIDEVEPADAQLIVRDGRFALATNRLGRQKLKVRFAVRLIGTTEGSHFHLTGSVASINTLAVSGIPEGQMLRIPDATQLSFEKDKASFRLPAQEQLDFDLVPQKPVAPPVTSRWQLATQTLIQFTDGKLNYSGHLAANADNGSGLTMELQFPAGVAVTKLTGPDLADWQMITAEDGSRRIQVRWQTRDILRRLIEIEYDVAQSATAPEWSLASPQLVNGETTPPLHVIIREPGLDLTSADQTPVQRQLPQWILNGINGRNYAVFIGDTPLTAKWLPTVESAPAIIESSIARMRIVPDGAALTEVEYKIHHERALNWRIDLPEGSELLSANVDGQPASPIDRGAHLVEFALPSGKTATTVTFSYTSRKPAFKPVSGQIAVELPQTDLLIHSIDWELRIPVAYEIAAFEGNVESASAGNATDNSMRVVQLHKELCRKERPHAEFFYQKSQPTN